MEYSGALEEQLQVTGQIVEWLAHQLRQCFTLVQTEGACFPLKGQYMSVD